MTRDDMNFNKSNSFLGRGWKFPVKVNPQTGSIETCSLEDDISESVRIIIMTTPGERVYRPRFGCDIKQFVYGLPDINTIALMKHEIEEALILWEPRIEKIEVEVNNISDNKNCFNIEVSYVVRITNNLYNKVFPFYLDEGVN